MVSSPWRACRETVRSREAVRRGMSLVVQRKWRDWAGCGCGQGRDVVQNGSSSATGYGVGGFDPDTKLVVVVSI